MPQGEQIAHDSCLQMAVDLAAFYSDLQKASGRL
jgi:hypothetical protein